MTWTNEYCGLAVTEMRAHGRQVEDEILTHISPAHIENVNFFGTIAVDIEHELAKLAVRRRNVGQDLVLDVAATAPSICVRLPRG